MTDELEYLLGLKPRPPEPKTEPKIIQNRTDTPKNGDEPKTAAEIRRQERIDALINAIFVEGLSFKRACEKVGIARSTGYEYFNQWKENEEVFKVDRKFWSLINKLEEENPEKVLDALTRLKIKLTAAKVDVKKEVTGSVENRLKIDSELAEALKDYDRLFNIANGNRASPTGPSANLSKNSNTKQVDSEASPPCNRQVGSD